jgi:aldehyde:ferredoxin oxidoreductase
MPAWGGFWGAELKKSDFGGIIFRGRVRDPVYLWIRGSKAELRKASAYWGMSTREADRAIKKDIGDTNALVAYTGPAGENLVRSAGIANDDGTRMAGRCGVGAVMGSKHLKAIAVHGTTPVRVYDEQDTRDSLKELTKILKADDTTKWTMKWGTSGSSAMMALATGIDLSPQEFLKAGERIYNLKRAFNFKHGMQKEEDGLPERLLNLPAPSGGAKGSVAKLDAMASNFLLVRGWDPVTHKPTRERFEARGMNDVANDLWPS